MSYGHQELFTMASTMALLAQAHETETGAEVVSVTMTDDRGGMGTWMVTFELERNGRKVTAQYTVSMRGHLCEFRTQVEGMDWTDWEQC